MTTLMRSSRAERRFADYRRDSTMRGTTNSARCRVFSAAPKQENYSDTVTTSTRM